MFTRHEATIFANSFEKAIAKGKNGKKTVRKKAAAASAKAWLIAAYEAAINQAYEEEAVRDFCHAIGAMCLKYDITRAQLADMVGDRLFQKYWTREIDGEFVPKVFF